MEQSHETEQQHDVVVEAEAPHPETRSRKSLMRGVRYGLGGIVLLAIVIGVIAAYRMPDRAPLFPRVLTAIHAPAAVAAGSVINWKDVAIDMDALNRYISNNQIAIQMPPDEMRQRVLHRLMYAAVAEKMLKEKDVTIDDAKIQALLADVIKQIGSEEKLTEAVQSEYGWTFDQYKTRVIRSMAVLQELQKAIDADPVTGGDRAKKAESILAEIKGGKDFAAAAREYSEDSSATDGGELGYIRKGMTVPEFEAAAFALKKGEISGIVKTQFGFHILQVEDIKKVKEAGQPDTTEIKVRHILVKNTSVQQVVEERLKSESVWQFMHTSVPAKNRLDT